MPFIKRRYIFEADDDNQEGANGTQNQVQSTANNGEDTANNDANNDDNNDQNSNDDTNNDQNDNEDTNDDQNNDEDNNDEDNEDDDYSIDAEPDEDDNNDDDNSDDNSDDSGDDNSDEEDTSEDQDTEEKQMDRDMFSTLSEDEQKRKIATLKRLFIDLYSKADGLIEKFGTIDDPDDENFMPIVKRILNILYDMKEYVSYYILNVFDKNSYIENDITFNRYLSVLNGIKLITEELEKEREKDDKDAKK